MSLTHDIIYHGDGKYLIQVCTPSCTNHNKGFFNSFLLPVFPSHHINLMGKSKSITNFRWNFDDVAINSL